MEINFKSPALSDGDGIRSILRGSDSMFCENTFGNIYCWWSVYGANFCITDGFLIVGHPERERFNFPVGEGDKKAIIRALIDKYPSLTLSCVSEDDKAFLEREFEGVFEMTELTERFDYIYESEKLCMLSGKKRAAKRNHINAFLADGEWHTERITGAHAEVLKEFNKKWCENFCGSKDSSLHAEMCVANRAIDNFDALCYDGLMLYKNGELIAYSLGERASRDMYCVHIEKADANVRGAYQMINREFCREFCKDVKYVNREDDAGDEGLRKAKKSYYPTELGRKYKAVIK